MRVATEKIDQGFSAPILIPALLGAVFGGVILTLAGAEARWIVYFMAATFYLVVAIAISDSARLFWVSLLFGLQFDVYLRIMYGHAGGGGFAVALPSILAGVLAISLFFHRGTEDLPSISWGGPLGGPILLLFVISFVSLIASSEQFVGATELFTFFQYYLIYLVALNYVVNADQLKLSIYLLLTILVIQCLIYYLQSSLGLTFTLTGNIIESGEIPRPGGTVSTRPAGFASFVMPLICISAAMFVTKRSKINGFWKTGLPTILGLIAIVLTFTRAAWASTVLGLALVALLSFRRKNLSSSKFVAICAVTVVAALAATPGIVARLEGSPLQESYDERVALMGMAVNVIREHPVTGVGPGAYRHAFKRYLTPEQRGQWVFTVHNLYLIRAAELGIAGAVSWIIFLLAGLRLAWRVSRSEDPTLSAFGIGCAGGVVAISFEMYWDIIIGFPYNALIWLLFGLLGAALTFEHREKFPADRTNRRLD